MSEQNEPVAYINADGLVLVTQYGEDWLKRELGKSAIPVQGTTAVAVFAAYDEDIDLDEKAAHLSTLAGLETGPYWVQQARQNTWREIAATTLSSLKSWRGK